MRADDIVRNRFRRVKLHQRHMFVGSGVKDDLRLVFCEQAVDAFREARVGDERRNGRPAQAQAFKVMIGLKDGVLAMTKEDQFAGATEQQLAAELMAD